MPIRDARAITAFYQDSADLHQARWAVFNDAIKESTCRTPSSALTTLQSLSTLQRLHDGIEPIPMNSAVWSDFSSSAQAIIELSLSPETFEVNKWEEKGIVRRSREGDRNREGTQAFYTRILVIEIEEYDYTIREYMSKYPWDVPFALVHATANGRGEVAHTAAREILDEMGLFDVRLPKLSYGLHKM